MIEYTHIDKRCKTKSVAVYEGQSVEFWHSLFDIYTQPEVEAYIKAEALVALGRESEALTVIQPHVSGENTYQIVNIEDEAGELTTIETGTDSRSFLKRWLDENITE